MEEFMARVCKFTESAVYNELRHNHREIKKDRNLDIDPKRSHLNYSLTPKREISELEYYKKRKNELYCYNRKDVKTMAGWIVTLPKEITSPDKIKNFFQTVSDFLMDRYGFENTISITTHFDEGKRLKLKDTFKHPLRDKSGKVLTEFHLGQPHLHFCFIPACKIDHKKLMEKKNHVKAMENYKEKISANDVLTKQDLQSFHSDLQKYLTENGVSGNVSSGITAAQGGNKTVKELKTHFEQVHTLVNNLSKENAFLKEKVSSLEKENTSLKNQIKKSIEREKLWDIEF